MKPFAVSSIGLAAIVAASMGTAQARDQIRIVGSSTVNPFTSYVAEEFGATTGYPTPVVESNGTGGGMKIFCEGKGLNTPDFTNASRRMKTSEWDRCNENGVKEIVEAKIGYDGIAIAQNKDNPAIDFTLEQFALAVLDKVLVDGKLVDNPYKKWSDIDSSLPDREIVVIGPPTTSGTRDSFEELLVERATKEMGGYPEDYSNLRKDGAWIDGGENDNLIVQKLENDKRAVGVFGYSFLEENEHKLSGAKLNGMEPNPDTIASGDYPVSRSMFVYMKDSHVGDVDGMMEFINLYMSDKMASSMGYLKGIGLIPMGEKELSKWQKQVADRHLMERSDIE